jgi:hypothetical protein
VKFWLETCQNTHSKCSQFMQQRKWCPSRLMDIGLNNDAQWRLISPRTGGINICKYMTLSYKWGFRPFLALMESTKNVFHCGLPIENLPPTFKDAVTICGYFGVRYLWIDAICIQQDSEEDWLHESIQMQHVYSNSICNIAAVASRDPYAGLFRARTPAIPSLGNHKLVGMSAKISISSYGMLTTGLAKFQMQSYTNVVGFF